VKYCLDPNEVNSANCENMDVLENISLTEISPMEKYKYCMSIAYIKYLK
jgi:hypothetical protein